MVVVEYIYGRIYSISLGEVRKFVDVCLCPEFIVNVCVYDGVNWRFSPSDCRENISLGM